MKYVPVEFDPGVNLTRRHPLREFAVLFGAAVALLAVFYILLGFAIESAARNISVSQEKWLWALTGTETADDWFVAADNDPETIWYDAYVQSLVDRIPRDMIGETAEYDLRVRVMWAEDPNAYAVPGGEIWVTTGMLGFVESENELMAVLGHEVGHFIGRDQLEGYGRHIVAFGASIILLGQDNGLADWISGTFDLLDLQYSRSQELDADVWGMQIATAIYGHTGGVTDFYRRMLDYGDDTGPITSFLSTHPGNVERIRQIETIAAEDGIPTGTPIPIDQSVDDFLATWQSGNSPANTGNAPANSSGGTSKKKNPPSDTTDN